MTKRKAGDSMAYEQGMSIAYDDAQELLTIFFRGQKYEIRNKFPDHASAIRAGEQHCKMLGWGVTNPPA
jgi:hypothetical protein